MIGDFRCGPLMKADHAIGQVNRAGDSIIYATAPVHAPMLYRAVYAVGIYVSTLGKNGCPLLFIESTLDRADTHFLIVIRSYQSLAGIDPAGRCHRYLTLAEIASVTALEPLLEVSDNLAVDEVDVRTTARPVPGKI